MPSHQPRLKPEGWKFFAAETFPADARLIDIAISVVRDSDGSDGGADLAMRYLMEAVGRTLLAAGYSLRLVDLLVSEIGRRAADILSIIVNSPSIKSQDDPTIALALNEMVKLSPKFLQVIADESKRGFSSIQQNLIGDTYFIEIAEGFDIRSARLPDLLKEVLAERLSETGMAPPEATRIARDAVRHFRQAAGSEAVSLLVPRAAKLAAMLVASVHEVMKNDKPTDAFRATEPLALPDKAKYLWKNKADRLPNETPIDFLRRVWGQWLDADVLYTDDLKALGDDRLARAVRDYCRANSLDAANYLPPPRSVRTDRAMAAAEPGSKEYQRLNLTLQQRDFRAKRAKRDRAP